MINSNHRMGGSTKRRLCGCGNLTMLKGRLADGSPRYGTRCHTCRALGRREKKDHCEICNFVALDPVQLDVDHIDANPYNNDPSNLQTLCANCHRLKSKQKNDWKKKNEAV